MHFCPQHGTYDRPPGAKGCPNCTRPKNAHWSKHRSRSEQKRFRQETLAGAGNQCEYVEDGLRCSVTGANNLTAHHDTPTKGRALCCKHHRVVDPHARCTSRCNCQTDGGGPLPSLAPASRGSTRTVLAAKKTRLA